MTQPPYGQEPQNPYGQPGPYAPPPGGQKSRTVIIGVVVLVLLLVAGGALAALLLLSDPDDDKDDSVAGDTATESTNGPTESTSSAPAGDLLQGNGYSYTLPEDWQDVSEEAAGAPGAIDTISVWGDELDGGRANVIVESGPSGGETDPEPLRDQWVKNMTSSTGAPAQEIPDRTIDGLDAIGVQIESQNKNEVEIVQTAYLAVLDGKVYSIGLSAKIGDDDAEQAFEEILESWTWE